MQKKLRPLQLWTGLNLPVPHNLKPGTAVSDNPGVVNVLNCQSTPVGANWHVYKNIHQRFNFFETENIHQRHGKG
jgi:hypothetical protein